MSTMHKHLYIEHYEIFKDIKDTFLYFGIEDWGFQTRRPGQEVFLQNMKQESNLLHYITYLYSLEVHFLFLVFFYCKNWQKYMHIGCHFWISALVIDGEIAILL